jgi:nucleotide-binding universal stress UspA family protein
MFRNIIVGVDGGAGSLDAIALGTHLLASDGALALAYVRLGGPAPCHDPSATSGTGYGEPSLEPLTVACAEAGVEAKLLTRMSTSVGGGLHDLAEKHRCDLLVVGASTRAFFGHTVRGGDTRAALNGAPCAVAVAPAGYAAHHSPLSEIGVAYNGSPQAEHALAVARELAAEPGRRVSAFEAVSIPADEFGGGVSFGDTVDGIVRSARERIEALGGVEAHAAYGPVIEELALYSASVDLLVVGSRGHGPLGRLVHGSTSNALARSARCPLLVLTRAAVASRTDAAAEPVAATLP